MADPQIEVLAVTCPDGDVHVRVFVDGVERDDFVIHAVDAGAGHTREDWNETTEWVRTREEYSLAFREAVVEARQDPPGSEYIEEDH